MACVSSLSSAASAQGLALRVAKSSSKAAVSRVALVCRCEKKEDSSTSAVTAAAVSASIPLFAASAANAVEAEQIVSALDQVESLSRQAAGVASQALDTVKAVTEQVVEAASPLVQAATPVVVDATKAAVEAAKPVASQVAGEAQKALSSSGVELEPVFSAAKTAASVAGEVGGAAGQAIDAASPYAQATFDTLVAQEPAVLAAGAGALFLLYLLAPNLASSVAYAARGYAGEFSAAQALDLLSKEDYTLIDVRSDNQRAKTGVPSLPRNSKKKLLSVPVEDLSGKLRGQLRNARKVEAEITAIKIGALKRLGKGSKIILIDSNGDLARLVAQSLANLGYKNTWVVKDGVDGSQGWINSQLGLDSSGLSLAEVLSPSRVISGSSAGTARAGRGGTLQVPAGRKSFLLPSAD